MKHFSPFSGRRFGLAAAALAVIMAIAALSYAEIVDRIVAIINDSIITLSELNAATALAIEKTGGDKNDAAAMDDMRKKVLDNLIEQKLVKQASDKAGIDVSEKEIDNAVEDIKKQNNMTQDALLLVLARNGLTYKEYREQLKEQIRQVKFMNKEFRSKIAIDPEDVEDFYRQHSDDFLTPASYRINMIFVPNGDKDIYARKLKAVEDGLSQKLDFKQLAREYSEGPMASSGGDMGYLKLSEIDKAIHDAVLKLKPGEVSAPIPAANGTYLVQLNDIKPPEQKPFDEVKDLVQDMLFKKIMDERFNFWLNRVKKYAHVEIRL